MSTNNFIAFKTDVYNSGLAVDELNIRRYGGHSLSKAKIVCLRVARMLDSRTLYG